MTAIKAIVYARVSTDDQADKGFSLAAQVEAGRKYAEAHGMTASHELIDDGISGAMAFSERPAGAVAWALLRSGKADALIVQNVDRLSRDVVDLLVTIRALLQAGVEVHCLDLGRVTSEYDIVLMLRGWQSGDERRKTAERTMRGKRQKAQDGFVIGARLPYGYDHLRDDRRRVVNFTVNEEQAPVVRLIFQLYTMGDGESGPLSIRAIAGRLSEAGVPTQRHAKRQRASWTTSTLSRILNQSAYKGEWRYTASARDNEPEKTFTIAVPAIVDPATWDAAQVQRERNARKAKRNGKRDYLLTGIIQCGCGYSMFGHTKTTGGLVYYECSTNNHFRRAERPCQERAIRADILDVATWDAVKYVVNNSPTLEADLREAQRLEDEEREPKTAELEAVNAMLAEAQADADKLARTLSRLDARGEAEGPVGDALQRQIHEVNTRHKDLMARREVLEAELSQRRVTDEGIATMLQFMADLREGVGNAEAEDKRGLLDTLNARIFVKDGKARMEYRLRVLKSIDLRLC